MGRGDARKKAGPMSFHGVLWWDLDWLLLLLSHEFLMGWRTSVILTRKNLQMAFFRNMHYFCHLQLGLQAGRGTFWVNYSLRRFLYRL